MRQLASIQQIKSLSPIPNADAIERAEVLGWELVVGKNTFKVGDLCIYCEIDSVLPELLPFEFLRTKKFRIKTIKLRGAVSQGIAFPLHTLTDVDPSFDLSKATLGTDVSDVLKITKYDPEAELDQSSNQVKKSWLANKWSYIKWKLFGIKRSTHGLNDFPTHLVPKTDETRVQNMGRQLLERVCTPVYITEKLDGTSSTFIYRRNAGGWLSKLFKQEGIFQVCSRNLIVQPPHMLHEIAVKYDLHQKMAKLNRNLAIQGETIGPAIQKNIYKLSERELRVFSIFDLDKRAYVSYDELCSLISELDLPMVPLLDNTSFIQNDVKHYVELSKGKSKLHPATDREGIVVRTFDSNFSFKSISPDFLLKQD